jgi:OOP family OmpA-OmpF porin
LNTSKIAIRLSLAASLGLMATVSFAQVPNNDGHLFDTRGVVAKSGYGLCWKTTRWTPAMALAECDPDLVKKPEPVKAAEMPPPPPKKCDFTFALHDAGTFAFAKSDLSAAAKAELDKEVIAKLGQCSKVNLILITGHTDRIGSQQGNQKLSEKRANIVKKYLDSKGVKADTIDTMGAGKTQPVPGVKCDDKQSRKKLVECLAPNRRVVIEVKGPAK